MSWIRLDDQFADHPKVVAAGPMAAWLFVCGLAYCARYLTDGFIPAGQVRRLADVEDVTPLVTRLVTAGMWEQVEDGYRVHDYLDYQPSAEQVRAERAATARRQAAWRSRRADPVPRNAVTNTAPVPIPSHPMREERDARTRADGADAPVSLSLVKPSESAEPEPAREQAPEGEAAPPSDPKAQSLVERALFDSWCIATGAQPRTAGERRSWVRKLAELHDTCGLTPPDVPRIVAQYRAKFGEDRNPTPGQVAGIFSQLGGSPYAAAAASAASAGRADRVHGLGATARGPDPEDLARRKRAALAELGVALPAASGDGASPHRALAPGDGPVPGAPDAPPGHPRR